MRFIVLLTIALGLTMAWQTNAIALGAGSCAVDQVVWADGKKTQDEGEQTSGEEEPDCE